MTGPQRQARPAQTTTPRSLEALADEWASAIGTTTSAPMSPPDTLRYLSDLLQRMRVALSGRMVATQTASDVGARLVAGDFTRPQSLSRTIEVLARGLPATMQDTAIGQRADWIDELLEALVAGYTEALQYRFFDRQAGAARAQRSSGPLADVTLESRTETENEQGLLANQTWFGELFTSSVIGIAISKPGGQIVQTNESLDRTLGYARSELLGHQLSELFAPDDFPALQQLYQHLLSSAELRFRTGVRLCRKDGELAWVLLSSSVLRDDEQQPRYLVTMVNDITEMHLLREQLNHQTLHDLQTGLPNRQHLLSHLEKMLGLLAPSAVVTLLRLTLGGFAAIRDGLGRTFGDQVLDVVADRLRKVVADQPAMVARTGDQEYAVLIEPERCAPDVAALAEAISTAIEEPICLDQVTVAVTATIGVVQQRAGRTKPTELLRAADATVRRLRNQSGRQWGVFDAEVDAADRTQLRLAATLPGALAAGQLHLQYQPVVTLDGGRLAGVEATMSWSHPQLGMLSHDRCLQLAEQTGAVHTVGQWLLRAAADQAVAWRQQFGADVPPMALNLAPSQARDPDLVAKVRAVLAQTGLPPAGLELRMPTTAICTSTGEPAGAAGDAEDHLRGLAELGVRLALHGFGNDIGGLLCLAQQHVDAMRIAQPAAQQVVDNPSAIPAQVLRALVPTMRAAGISVIACLVDSDKLAAWWQAAGADYAVGALFGRPGPAQHLEPLLVLGSQGR